ncbi:MAG: 50S ribosomal protein L23 [Patescibacteria group bacterium]
MKTADVLKQPIISEKILRISTNASGGWYGFKISMLANKKGVKAAVEKAFSVEVAEIRLLREKGKKIRDINKKRYIVKNKRTDTKKAYVKLKPGFSINLLGEDKEEEKKKKSKSKAKGSKSATSQNKNIKSLGSNDTGTKEENVLKSKEKVTKSKDSRPMGIARTLLRRRGIDKKTDTNMNERKGASR